MKLLGCHNRKRREISGWANVPVDPEAKPNAAVIVTVDTNSNWLYDYQKLLKTFSVVVRDERCDEDKIGMRIKMTGILQPSMKVQAENTSTSRFRIDKFYYVNPGNEVQDIFAPPDPTHRDGCKWRDAKKEKCCNPKYAFLRHPFYSEDKTTTYVTYPMSYSYNYQPQPLLLPPPSPRFGEDNSLAQTRHPPLLLPPPPPPQSDNSSGWPRVQPYYYRDQEEYSACSIM